MRISEELDLVDGRSRLKLICRVAVLRGSPSLKAFVALHISLKHTKRKKKEKPFRGAILCPPCGDQTMGEFIRKEPLESRSGREVPISGTERRKRKYRASQNSVRLGQMH